MPPQLLCHLCHLPEGGEVLLENATPTAVPAVPPAMGERCCLKMPPRLLCQLCHLSGGGEELLENATPTAVTPVPPARGWRGAA